MWELVLTLYVFVLTPSHYVGLSAHFCPSITTYSLLYNRAKLDLGSACRSHSYSIGWPARVAMPSTLRIVILAIITVAVCSGAGFGIGYYTKVGEATPAMWVGLTVGGAFGLGVVAGYAAAMQHPNHSASGNMAAASPQAEGVAWLPAMQHPGRGQLFQANVRSAAANDVKIVVNDDDDDDGLCVDDPSLDMAVNGGDGGLDQLFGAPKQAVAAAAGGTPKTPTVDMRTAMLRSNLNSDVSQRSPGGSPSDSFLRGEEGSGSPLSERNFGRPRGSGLSPMSSPSSTLSKGKARAELQQEAAVATAAAAAAAAAAAKSIGAGLQLTASQLRGTQGAPSPRSSPRGPPTPKGWPPGKAPPPGLPPGQEGRKPSATQSNEGVPRSCISPRSHEGGGRPPGDSPPPMLQAEMQAPPVSFPRGSPSARRARPDLGAPSLSRAIFPPPPPRRPTGQFSVPPVRLVQNAAPTSQQKLSGRSSSTPAGQHFAAAAAALRQEEEEAKQQATLRRNERLERAKTENYRRRESGSTGLRDSDGAIRVMTPVTKAPISPKGSPLVDGPFESEA